MLSKVNNPQMDNSQINVSALLRGTGMAFAASVGLVALSGISLYFSTAVEKWIPLITLGIFFFSVLFGGYSAARTAGCKGLFHGLGVGILFLLVTLIISLFIPGELLGLSLFKKIVCSLLGGFLGGIWGVGNK